MKKINKNPWLGICVAKDVATLCLMLAVAGAIAPQPARALSADPMIEGAKQCTRYLPRNERKYGIPLHLLSAIASTESGRWHNGLNMALPWPWTVNAEGKGYYFDSKEQALAEVRKMQARGITSIDVGCMQVNLKHHKDAFSSLSQAFDPRYNVDYAARFLKTNYESERSWRKAAAAYHSKTPEFGNKYVSLVYKSWQRIVGQLRLARSSTAGYDVATSGLRVTDTDLARTENSLSAPVAAKVAPSGKVLKVTANGAREISKHRPPHMRSIKVYDEAGAATHSEENGVMVIRPRIEEKLAAKAVEPAPAKPVEEKLVASVEPANAIAALPGVAGAKPTPAEALNNLPPAAGPAPVPAAVAVSSAPDAEIIDISRSTRSVDDTAARRRGPNFIFD